MIGRLAGWHVTLDKCKLHSYQKLIFFTVAAAAAAESSVKLCSLFVYEEERKKELRCLVLLLR